MKILHVASGNSGGAYQAAVGLNDLLLEYGTDSRIITSQNRSISKRLISKIYTLTNRVLTRREFGIMSLKSYDGVTHGQLARMRPDVIHIHNWFNMFSVETLSKITEIAPTVITMHDERLLTGGCHNHLDCAQIDHSCVSCPASTISIDRFIVQNRIISNDVLKNERIEIVVPSAWMKKQVEKYVIGGQTVTVIPNPVHKIFTSQDKPTNRKGRLEEPTIGFIAANPWVPLKGLRGLIKSLSEVESITGERLSLKIVGEIQRAARLPGFAVTVGTKKGSELVEFLDEIDYLVVPSLSENFPNIITEAQLRGTVVVATRVGGIPDMIDDGYDGFLQQTDESLTSLILRVLRESPSTLAKVGQQAKVKSSIRNSREKIYLEHQSLYLKVISNA